MSGEGDRAMGGAGEGVGGDVDRQKIPAVRERLPEIDPGEPVDGDETTRRVPPPKAAAHPSEQGTSGQGGGRGAGHGAGEHHAGGHDSGRGGSGHPASGHGASASAQASADRSEDRPPTFAKASSFAKATADKPASSDPPRAHPIGPKEILDHLERVIVGKREKLKLVLAAYLARGHVLIEDVPGVAKTLLARTLAKTFKLHFSRVQMTPDLLPADLTGTSIWDEKKSEFVFRPGPIFTQVLLADELNRATPRTQSGLLEAMEERTVSADGKRYALPKPFFVIATQNPVEQSGVFPLPEAQLDRFLIQVRMGYPDLEEEVRIVEAQAKAHPIAGIEPILDAEGVLAMQDRALRVHVDASVTEYMVRIVRATRSRSDVALGVSPRASIGLHHLARALAYVEGETFVRPDHVKRVAPSVLRHRMVLTPQARLSGGNTVAIIDELLEAVEVPIYGGAA